MKPSFLLTFEAPDQPGIQAQTATLLNDYQATLIDVASFSDPDTQRFFSRIEFQWTIDDTPLSHFEDDWKILAQSLQLTWQLKPLEQKMRTLIAVSKEGHCLNDLLYRAKYRNLPINIVGVVSNHENFRGLVEHYQLPFHHLPIPSPEHKHTQEQAIQRIADETEVELMVLARYMQILSPSFSEHWHGRCINIHHSFLPSFKGAHPYQRAFERGVKMIGATAHYVTADLDEGPIIEQRTDAITHKQNPTDLRNKGRDIESIVLAHAVRWHAERRIFLAGHKTIIFK